ncbi:MAG TPA: hypothetical protein VH092_09615 [Urbifossiella sp.]|jgi:hypothetical protein|nr:hypothetical protein [Urbifossiella sp.]
MTLRTPAAALVLLALAGEAAAQPIAPPRRPTFTSYSSLYSPGGGYYGLGYGGLGYGFNPYGFGGYGLGLGGGAGPQALMLQQLNQTNQAVANMQQFLAYGVNPVLSPTGRGATFNNLSHWYPTYRGGGSSVGAAGGGGLSGYGGYSPQGGATGMMGAAMTGGGAAGGGGGALPTTSGNGIPLGRPKR